MSIVEETIRRSLSRRSRHEQRGGAGADWPAAAARGPAQPIPTVASTSSSASARPQEIAGPTKRQSSRDSSVESAGQHTPPDQADLLFKVCRLIHPCILAEANVSRLLVSRSLATRESAVEIPGGKSGLVCGLVNPLSYLDEAES